MAKRRRDFTDRTIIKMISEGRGIGEGIAYKPWITIRDLPSKGRCTEILGWKTGRMHHLLSKLETKYFFHLEWSDDVIDIREQFPLLDEFDTYSETIEIAKQIGVEYPIIPKTRTPNVMTTDFLITVISNGEEKIIARTIKYAKDLSDTRTIEKLEVERIFWERRGVGWKIVTERQISENLSFNVEYVHQCKTLIGFDYVTLGMIERVSEELNIRNFRQDLSLADLAVNIDSDLRLDIGTTLFVLKHLIANKVAVINMKKKIDTAKHLVIADRRIYEMKEAIV